MKLAALPAPCQAQQSLFPQGHRHLALLGLGHLAGQSAPSVEALLPPGPRTSSADTPPRAYEVGAEILITPHHSELVRLQVSHKCAGRSFIALLSQIRFEVSRESLWDVRRTG